MKAPPLAAAALVLLFAAPSAQAQEKPVRVAVLQEVPNARIAVPAPFRLTDTRTGAVLGEWPELKSQEIQAGSRGIRIGELELGSESVLVEPLGEGQVRINTRQYRGELLLQRTSSGRMTIINLVDMEDYLVGALASEASADWPVEALKAHAVVSRTVVAHRMWINRDRSFDMTSDTRTHLYHGASAERQGTRQAVLATKGQVLIFNKQLLSAAFHANCGGHTENAAALWDVRSNLTPLKGVRDPYCKGLKHFTWKAVFGAEQILETLGELGQVTGPLQSCEVAGRNPSGRVTFVRLTGSKGSVEIPGRRLRELLGANRLRSLNFRTASSGNSFSFEGFGWGHGVGLCQWGAYGMAKKGKKMDEILSFYFPSAEKKQLQGLPGFRNS